MKVKQSRIEVILCILCMVLISATLVFLFIDRDWTAVWTSIGAVGCLYGAIHFKNTIRG